MTERNPHGRSAAIEGTPGCVQFAGKYYLPAIWQYVGRRSIKYPFIKVN
jgi:hypothetical protein